MKPRVFIDSSVLFSAIYSASGHSNDILSLCVTGEVIGVITDFVYIETRRNIQELKPEKIVALDKVFTTARFEIVDITPRDVAEAKQWIILKDAPILAAAKVAGVDMLVTLDRKHFLGKPELSIYINAPILTPAQAFQKIKASL